MQIRVPSPGKALIAFKLGQVLAQKRYAEMANCKSCDKELAQSYHRAAEFFASLCEQITHQTTTGHRDGQE